MSNRYAPNESEPYDEDMSDMEDGSSDEDTTDESSIEEEELGLTENQKRLLYMISLYSAPAESGADKERWIRQQAILVMIYEGIVAQVYDYDYAPSSELVEGRRLYFNISQEGKTDLDFLREEELVNGLKISSKDHTPVTMYQVSNKGLEIVRQIPRFDRDAVHRLCFSPAKELLQVIWDGGDYWLAVPDAYGQLSADLYRKRSSVLAIEAVSYVSSAYIPACLRQGGRPTLSNAHRATECVESGDAIRDDLDEVITLNSVSVIVAEYIPFGTNLLVELNYSMGSVERVQGGFFTAAVEDSGEAAAFHMEPGLTAVQILDYSVTGHINMEADIRLPEPEGIVQVETFGVSIQSLGTCFYGLQLEAVMDRIKDAISLDHLSRLLADVQTDSSEIIEPMLSPSQRRILDLVFRGDAPNRNKVNLIVASEITPHLTAEEYLDKGEFENELKQVVGDTRAAFDITQYDTLVFGEKGLLLAGPNSRTYEPLLIAYLQLISMDLFVRNYFQRIAQTIDNAKDIRIHLTAAREDPILLTDLQARLPLLSRKLVVLEKVQSYLKESIDALELPDAPSQQAGRALFDRLATPRLLQEMMHRVRDVEKSLGELREELLILEKFTEHVARERDREIHRFSREQTGEGLLLQKEALRDTAILRSLQVIMCGILAFEILDTALVQAPQLDIDLLGDLTDYVFPPAVFVAGLLLWLLIKWYQKSRVRKAQEKQVSDELHLRLELRNVISVTRLHLYLESKKIEVHDWRVHATGDYINVSWREPDVSSWGGVSPRISLEYSAQRRQLYFLAASFPNSLVRKSKGFNAYELREKVEGELRAAGVILQDPRAPNLLLGQRDVESDVATGLPSGKANDIRPGTAGE